VISSSPGAASLGSVLKATASGRQGAPPDGECRGGGEDDERGHQPATGGLAVMCLSPRASDDVGPSPPSVWLLVDARRQGARVKPASDRAGEM